MANVTLNVTDAKGQATGTVEAPAELFGISNEEIMAHVPLVHQVVVAQLAAARQGTHAVKNRGAVSGGGKKPWKQKGTGRARQGSVRAPEHTGGGVVHGPTPRDYSQRTPKKMIAAALLGSLSDRARGGRISAVEGFVAAELPSTKTARTLLEKVAPVKNVLVVLETDDELTLKSIRNLPNVHALSYGQLNAYDVLRSDAVVFSKSALDAFIASKTAKEITA